MASMFLQYANQPANTRAPDYNSFKFTTTTDLGPVARYANPAVVVNPKNTILADGTMLYSKPKQVLMPKPDTPFGQIKVQPFLDLAGNRGDGWADGMPDVCPGKPNMPVDFALAAAAANADQEAERANYIATMSSDPVGSYLQQVAGDREVAVLMDKIKRLTAEGFAQEEIKAAILGMRTAKADRIMMGAKY
jgi:hypothetical protein